MNIAGLTPVEDPSYRYKMPRMTAKVEGRGNGIKTVLTNVFEVGLSLNRDPSEITKFFGCEMGTQSTFSADTERAVVNGSHNPQDLQNKLSIYIENYVLCKQCRLPETVYKIKGGVITQRCMACGSKDDCDMTHKLSTFIANQYKKNKAEKAEKEKKEGGGDKSDKKKEKKDKKSSEETKEPATEEEKKAKKEKKEKKAKKAAEAGGDGDNEGDNENTIDENDLETDSKAVGKYYYFFIYNNIKIIIIW